MTVNKERRDKPRNTVSRALLNAAVIRERAYVRITEVAQAAHEEAERDYEAAVADAWAYYDAHTGDGD